MDDVHGVRGGETGAEVEREPDDERRRETARTREERPEHLSSTYSIVRKRSPPSSPMSNVRATQDLEGDHLVELEIARAVTVPIAPAPSMPRIL